MKWLCLTLLVLGGAALGFGLVDFNANQGMDKMGGAWLSMIGIFLLGLDFVIFFIWLCVRAFS